MGRHSNSQLASPLSAYMQAFLECGLRLLHFDEPASRDPNTSPTDFYNRVPYFVVMHWQKTAGDL